MQISIIEEICYVSNYLSLKEYPQPHFRSYDTQSGDRVKLPLQINNAIILLINSLNFY